LTKTHKYWIRIRV